jgi:intein-encoded DNA endonuclease-like protein
MSENSISADNQQERLSRFGTGPSELGYYIAGFADGEGSFNISFRRRRDYRLLWKISACFNISQKEKEILLLVQQELGCGTLRSRPDGVWYYEVNTLRDIQERVIPYFERFPFLSEKKKRDFILFQRIITLLASKSHLSQDGIKSILEIRRSMNNGGKRKFSENVILSAFKKESSETIRQISSA